MKRWLLLFSWSTLAAGSGLHAQDRDAGVLRPGEVRLSAEAEYWHIDSRFGGPENRSIASGLEGDLTPTSFPPLATVEELFSGFLDETAELPDAAPVDPATLSAGSVSVDAVSTTRYLPFRLAVGVLPRVELGARLPVYRMERLFRRFDVFDGNLGLNPDPTANLELLAGLTPSSGALAQSALLPVAGTPLADELQKRVLALTGEELSLPEGPVNGPQLREAVDGLPGSYFLSLWNPGDLRVDARVRLLGTFGSAPFPDPEAGGTHFRLTGFGAARFPTGRRPSPDWGVGPTPPAGFAGGAGGAVADLFLGRTIWVSGGGSVEVLRAADVFAFVPGEEGPFDGTSRIAPGRLSPGSHAEFWLLPRLRLTPTISLGAVLRSERRGEGSLTVDGNETTLATATSHAAGFSVRYTTLPVATGTGFEAAAGYTHAFRGSDGADARGVAFLQFSLQRRIFGGP